MADRYDIFYESPDGDTSNATQPFLPLEWQEASITFRRRAPHSGTLTIPGAAHHVPSDFVAGRELIIKRNGASWFAGIMDAVSISGAPGQRGMTLPFWGQAKVLDFIRDLTPHDYRGLTTSQIVGDLLDNAVHGATPGVDTPWFPSAGRKIGVESTTFDVWVISGKSALSAITEICDADGLAWYVGVDSTGAWTFTTAATPIGVDLHGLRLVDGSNCVIASVDQDGSQIASEVAVYARIPDARTTLAAGASAGATTITLTDVDGFANGDLIIVGQGNTKGINEETATIQSISSSTLTLTSGLDNSHFADEFVVAAEAGGFRATTRTSSGVDDDHHLQTAAIHDDTLASSDLREARGDIYLTAYDHVLQTVRVRVTDRALLDLLAWQPLLGNGLQLISNDRLLADLFGGTGASLTVQDYTLTLRGDGAARMDLTLGDPALDDLAVLERRTAAGHAAATATPRT